MRKIMAHSTPIQMQCLNPNHSAYNAHPRNRPIIPPMPAHRPAAPSAPQRTKTIKNVIIGIMALLTVGLVGALSGQGNASANPHADLNTMVSTCIKIKTQSLQDACLKQALKG
jgi:hypothetical protein